ncbi:MAG: response regulator [Candidatus Zambryskibacteria bacterium]|nr:response regulator [Candidatus Zambryskibacteria bacterium]
MKKILIIEDDIFLGDVLVQKLVKEGFETILARDGAEGFQQIRSIKPDLILLDIILPNMNGYEILEAKAKDNNIADIPVIVISNSGQPVEINRVLALGVKDYLVKAQFDPEEIMVKVRSQLRKNDTTNDKHTYENENTVSKGQGSSLEGKKIMWIEDDKFLNDIISRKLSSTKCTFFHSSEGEESLTMISEKMPDIILLDIVLPGMDGFEILKKIKADKKTKHIPVIMLSNLGQQSNNEKSKSLGATRFLIKATVTLDDIIEEIKSVIAESEKK